MVECPDCGGRLELEGYDDKVSDDVYVCKECLKEFTIEITEIEEED